MNEPKVKYKKVDSLVHGEVKEIRLIGEDKGHENEKYYFVFWLNHNDVLTLGKLSFSVKHCPGHTPGHIVFYEPDQQLVIVGDVIFKGAVGRTDFPKGNTEQLIESIKSHILTLDDNTRILAGHGEDTTVGHEKRTNPFVSGQFG